MVQNAKYKMEYAYMMALARCHIYNGQARKAWELYLKVWLLPLPPSRQSRKT